MVEPVQPLTHTVEETARILRIGRNQAYEAVAAGQIPSIRIGKRILVPRLALEALLSKGIESKRAEVQAAA